MAQTGFTPLLIYASGTASSVPLAANLASTSSGAELALNYADGKLFYKDNSGVIQVIANKSTATGNLPGGGVGTVVYQSAAGVTAYLALGTSGYLLTSNGTSGPVYTSPASLTVGNAANATFATTAGTATSATTATTATTAGSATTATTAASATNIAGGSANRVVYQSAAGATAFVPAPTVTGYVLGWDGTNLTWVNAPSSTIANNLAGGAAFQVPYQSAPNTTQFSNNFQFNGTFLRVGNTAPLTGATNPTFAATGSTNQYVQSYIYNANVGTSASADFVAYADNSTDAHGWADVGFTSSVYADTTYTVTGPNESYVFGSAPTSSGTTGNLVYATDNTGTANAHQWYVGGFTQAKSAWKMQLTSTGLQLANALAPAYGGTGLTAPGAAGNLLTSTGTGWVSAAQVPAVSKAFVYFMSQS